MSEIEKMYENAKIDYEERYNDCTLDMEGECHLNIDCDLCNYSKEKYIYPTFTAEKQLNLIKWLIVHSPSTCLEDEIIVSAFEDSLANIINDLWQDLNEEERNQIKDILE